MAEATAARSGSLIRRPSLAPKITFSATDSRGTSWKC